MNEKKFKILSLIYKSLEPLYLREIVEKTRLPYGTVQAIINKNIDLFDIKQSGKNKYFSLKNSLSNYYLKQEIECERMRHFIRKRPELIPFVDKCINSSAVIVIFGSYASGTEKKDSDIDILVIGSKEALPEYLCPYKIHKISINTGDIAKFKKEALYSEIISNHLILSNIEYCLNKVFSCYSEIV